MKSQRKVPQYPQKSNVRIKNLVFSYFECLCTIYNRVAGLNFGHPAQTSSFAKCKILQVTNNFATIVHKLSDLKLFQLPKGDVLFS